MKCSLLILFLALASGCSTPPRARITYLPGDELPWTKEMLVGHTMVLNDSREVLWLRFRADDLDASFGSKVGSMKERIVWMGHFVWKIEDGRLMLLTANNGAKWRSFGLIHADEKSLTVEEKGDAKRFTIE